MKQLKLLILTVMSLILLLTSFTIAEAKDVHVKGYYRKNGTYVSPHYRSAPDGIKSNNFSHCGNVNPYTGKTGTVDCNGGTSDYSSSNYSPIANKPIEEIFPAGSYKATIPNYKVKINGQNIDNTNNKYPVLVYKDITYFPMTWNYTNALGLETNWNADTGFSIRKSGANVTKITLDTGEFNLMSGKYIAKLPDYNVFVNDTWVDNSQEEYPVISFRDVTYFPMTWHFAVEELGLVTNWTDSGGFSIQKN
jgi:hypothetical protein